MDREIFNRVATTKARLGGARRMRLLQKQQLFLIEQDVADAGQCGFVLKSGG